MGTSIRFAAAALLAAALQNPATAAAAATARVSFSGVVTSAVGGTPVVGETITGSFTLTPDPAYSVTSGVPGKSTETDSTNPGTSPLLVTGSARFQDGSVLSLASSPDSQRFFERVVRDGSSNSIDLLSQTNVGFDNEFLRVALQQSQADCAVQCLFADPAGGLAVDQPLDLSAPGVQAQGFYGGTTVFGTYFGAFELTSVSITLSPVPEPAPVAMLLAGVGLLGAMVRRRRRA